MFALLLGAMQPVVATTPALPAYTIYSETEWLSTFHRDHILTGRIWDSESGEFISQQNLLDALTDATVLLLGEKHDNPDHHQLRLELLTLLLERKDIELLAMEMFSESQNELLTGLTPSSVTDNNNELRGYLQWDEQGWTWDFYQPLLQTVISAGVPVVAANIDRERVLDIYRSSEPVTASNLLDEKQLEQLSADIDSSHCGLLPASQFPAMVRIQQTRDQQMAHALMQGSGDMPAGAGTRILIAGNYHIRRDLGVPNYLPDLQTETVSVAFLETDPDVTDPYAYLKQFSEVLPFDYIWFTPAVRNDDYCADMAAGN
jgi:uncharacterized iron-regulated protein